METDAKYGRLKEIVKELGDALVAYSGGVDSTLLLKVCADALGPDRVLAFIAASETYPEREVEAACAMAKSLGVQYEVVRTAEMEDGAFLANTKDRCYHCKLHLFDDALKIAQIRGFRNVLEGSNVDDQGDYRPGRRAIAEKRIRSPLLEAGLTKEGDTHDIRTAWSPHL